MHSRECERLYVRRRAHDFRFAIAPGVAAARNGLPVRPALVRSRYPASQALLSCRMIYTHVVWRDGTPPATTWQYVGPNWVAAVPRALLQCVAQGPSRPGPAHDEKRGS